MMNWDKNLTETEDTPSKIPIYHILRMSNMAKAFDMLEYGKMRYNLLGSGGHWFPGAKADDSVDWRSLRQCLSAHPFVDRILKTLKEAHQLFNAEEVKRLSESD